MRTGRFEGGACDNTKSTNTRKYSILGAVGAMTYKLNQQSTKVVHGSSVVACNKLDHDAQHKKHKIHHAVGTVYLYLHNT